MLSIYQTTPNDLLVNTFSVSGLLAFIDKKGRVTQKQQ
jgi:hypothetical protein